MNYYLNEYQKTGHYIFALDYQITIAMTANSQVTLDVVDRKERQVVNYEKYAVVGVSGSINFGQFVQLSVVAVRAR